MSTFTANLNGYFDMDIPDEQPTPTLHGRPLRTGDRVWCIPLGKFLTVHGTVPNRIEYWTSMESVLKFPQDYSWDEPPVQDLSKIEPPLFFVEDLPVRKGSVMFDKAREIAVTVKGVGFAQYVSVIRPQKTASDTMDRAHLSFTFPNVDPNPKPVMTLHVRKRWFNIYEGDAVNERNNFQTYASESQAKLNAITAPAGVENKCLGQGYFAYQLVGPSAKPSPSF